MKKIVVTFLILFSSNATSCSFFLERSTAYPKLGFTVIILGISLWMLFYCYPQKKTLTNFLVVLLEAIPIILIVKNWNELALCVSKVIFPAYAALLISIVILLVSFGCVLWKWLKIKQSAQQ